MFLWKFRLIFVTVRSCDDGVFMLYYVKICMLEREGSFIEDYLQLYHLRIACFFGFFSRIVWVTGFITSGISIEEGFDFVTWS